MIRPIEYTNLIFTIVDWNAYGPGLVAELVAVGWRIVSITEVSLKMHILLSREPVQEPV